MQGFKSRIRGALTLSVFHFVALLVAALGISVLAHGVEGAVFTGAIALAFLLGAIDRSDKFRLRAAARPGAIESPAAFEAACVKDRDTLCIMLEVDDVHDLRSRYGARALDEITTQLSQRLQGRVRADDGFAVLGAGRFGVRLQRAGTILIEDAVQAAVRLQSCARTPLRVDGLDLRVGLSAGVAHLSRLERARPRPSVPAAATLALEEAKAAGPRSLRAFEPEMVQRQPVRQTPTDTDAARTLIAALEAGQIIPWFQPQISCDTGTITGAEALARWIHPDLGVLAPGRFLDMAQQAGCMTRLTDRILDATLTALVRWDRAGIGLPRVSINMGPVDLADPMLVERVRWALDRHEIAPERLGIEILESVAAGTDPEDACARNVLALAALGCVVELDDFGTGSASIAGIRRFRVSRIKIDRSLVTALDTDRRQHAMVAAILTMADQLGVDVLAEGVETPEEHAALAALGVSHVQGFAIARPMSANDLTAWIRRSGHPQTPLPPARAMPATRGKTPLAPPPVRADGKTA